MRRARENPIELPLLLAMLAAGAAVTGGVVVAAVAAKKNAAAPPALPPTTVAPSESTSIEATSAEDAAIAAASANAATVAQNITTTQQNNFLASLPAATQTFTFAKGATINLNVGDTLNLIAPIAATQGMIFRFVVYTKSGSPGGLGAVPWNGNASGSSVSLGAGCFKALQIGTYVVSLDQIDIGSSPPVPGVNWVQNLTVNVSNPNFSFQG
jgi:hypothetical protein